MVIFAQTPQGIPGLPDLTHPQELINLGQKFLMPLLVLILLIGGLGIVLAVFNWGLSRRRSTQISLINTWQTSYYSLLRGVQHTILILILVVIGFLLCSTLANRYHYWEQTRITAIAATVTGERLEQPAPKVRYVFKEPYSYFSRVGEQLVKVEDTREVDRFLPLNQSNIQVTIDEVRNRQDDSNNYAIDFKATYKVTNTLSEFQELFFEMSPPYNYTILKNFLVEREKERLMPTNTNQYSFPLALDPNQSVSLNVSYQAQGAPRWVYNAQGELLSNFNLTVKANFPKADFASGIAPSDSKLEDKGTVFTWVFRENVSVANPFGVFTATDPVKNTGVVPRLLLLAPFIFVWWILLLYLSVPLKERDVALAAGVFFAGLLALTYFSRLIDVKFALAGVALVWLGLVWGLGTNLRTSLAAIICTISGAILPILGLLVAYSGLTLSLAGLLSIIWLGVQNWYKKDSQIRPSQN